MAALLKKRALAEFSQVLQEEPPRQVKRLRIVKKSTGHTELDFDQLKNLTSSDAINFLSQVSDALDGDLVDSQPLYRTLLDHYHREHESFVRVKLVSVLCEMIQKIKMDSSVLVEDLFFCLKGEASHKVVRQILLSCHIIGKLPDADKKLHCKFLTLAKQHLLDNNHKVKCVALCIIGEFSSVDDHSGSYAATLALLAEYTHIQEPRVRTAALNALLYLHNRGMKLEANLYNVVAEALSDDHESVKMAALKLIEVISHLHAENLVNVEIGDEKIRLADNAFAKICNMINDSSVNVRVLAASLLGNFSEVSISFLEQTLDKKLMSNLRKKRTAHERQKEIYESGEWSTGKKWGNDAAKEEIDAESVSLMSSGACGAFLHGLEDEFLEVRSATLDSLCMLAVQFPSFATLALDFLVDMFNDEIEEVRLKAVWCLQKISQHIMLREDQLTTILGVLEDFSMDLREALHEMLGLCTLSTKECLKTCVDNLLENLKRYPQDKRSIWRCLQKLGFRHPYLTLPLVPELLSMHHFIDMAEQNIEDPAYICNLILVFNAAVNCPVMMSLFDEFTQKHYSYLKDTLPQLVPQLKLSISTGDPPYRDDMSDEESKKFLRQVLERASMAERRNPSARQNLLEISIQDLNQLSEIEPKLCASANCAAMYIQCQLLLAKIVSNKNWLNTSLLSPLQSSALKSSLKLLLQFSFCLNHQFLRLTAEEAFCLRQIRLRALALQLMVLIRGSNTSALGPCEAFLEQVDSLQKYQEENCLHTDNFTAALFRELDSLDDPKPGTVARVLQPLLQSCPCPSLRLNTELEDLERIKQASAVIHEPSADSDTLLKFTAGLIQGITMDAEIENVEDIKTVKVKVKYPDQQTQIILPRLSDFRQQGHSGLQYRLYTTVLLSHGIWSEACHVSVSLVLDFSETEANKLRTSQKNSLCFKVEDSLIELCKPVRVNIAPKANFSHKPI